MPKKQMSNADQIGARTQVFNEEGESQWVKSGGLPQGWYYEDPTLEYLESMPEEDDEDEFEDDEPDDIDPQRPEAG